VVYDGYYGAFVPIEDASFDAATTPDAVVELPWPIEEPKRGPTRPQRSRPRRCDACRRRRRDVQRSRDGDLAVCRQCAGGVDVPRLDAAEAINGIVARAPAAERRDLQRSLARRRAVRSARRARRTPLGDADPSSEALTAGGEES
jgi:hypothetical protein